MRYTLKLLGVFGCPALADDRDPDLPGVLHGLFDLLGDVLGHAIGLDIVDLVGFDDDAYLAACLDGVTAFDAFEAVGDSFQRPQPFNVLLQILTAGTRAGA